MSKRKIYPIKEENIGVIPLGGKNKGKYAIIDFEDIAACQKCNWHLCGQGYVKTRTPDSRHINLHKYIYEYHSYYEAGMVIDHIDGNKLNNRKDNLRYITQQQNTWNRKKHSNNKSGFKGVTFKDNHWVARITHNGKAHHLGFFKLFEDAVKARLDAEFKYFGEYRSQFIDSMNPSQRVIRRRNISKNNTSGFTGVQKTKQGKWIADITVKGKRLNLGTYHTKETAIQARIQAEEKLLNRERKVGEKKEKDE